MNTIILHSKDQTIAQQIGTMHDIKIEHRATHIRLHTPQTLDLQTLRQHYQQDFNQLPVVDFRQLKLLATDMDSTLIAIECMDEMADFADLKPQVAAITKRAMHGELDFDTALWQRIALLKGLDVAVLDQVYTHRLRLNSGGRRLIEFLQSKAIKTAVISGGFSYFTERLAKDLGLDYACANNLEIKNKRITGNIKGSIINAQAKADFVQKLCQKHHWTNKQVMVVGDGDNDLLMMDKAGTSIAYHAKPVVVKQANVAIYFGGLDKIIDFFDDE